MSVCTRLRRKPPARKSDEASPSLQKQARPGNQTPVRRHFAATTIAASAVIGDDNVRMMIIIVTIILNKKKTVENEETIMVRKRSFTAF